MTARGNTLVHIGLGDRPEPPKCMPNDLGDPRRGGGGGVATSGRLNLIVAVVVAWQVFFEPPSSWAGCCVCQPLTIDSSGNTVFL